MDIPFHIKVIYCMPCRTPCRLYIYSNFVGPLSPQALVKSEVRQSLHFPPMRDFRIQWSRALKFSVESTPSYDKVKLRIYFKKVQDVLIAMHKILVL